jgi:predicted permease
MNPLTNLITGLKSLLFKRRVDRDLDEELQSYLEASVADKQRSGLSRKAARRLAKVEIGSQSSVKHQVWSSRWESALDSFFKDVRFGIRGLTKRPGFTLVALLSLALGIGANTAIFTLINQVVLRNMPVREPNQLVIFGKGVTSGILGGVDLGTYHMYTYDFARQLEANPGPFTGVAAYSSFAPRVSVRIPESGSASSSGAAATQVTASLVSGNYFSVLQASPLLGRTILPTDAELRGGSPVAVISYHYWQQQLSSDPNVLGKTLTINSNPFRIIGVMPAGFDGIKPDLEPPSIWTPLTMQQQIMVAPDMLAPRSTYFLHMFARLADPSGRTVSPSSSVWKNAQLWLDQQIRAYIRAGEGGVISADRQQEINRATEQLLPGSRGVSYLGARYGDTLNVLMIVVGLVLLIACANLANFLLARAVTRQREIATRLALGSSRARIVRQSLIETLLLSLAGGALGLATAFIATRALIAFVSNGVAHTPLSPLPDLPVLLFTLGVSLTTGLLFGLGPAIHSARAGASASLSFNARAVTGSRSTRLAPKILVTSQIMLSLLLLVGAGLFLRTLRNLQSRNFGFERSHLLLADIAPILSGRTNSQAASLNQNLIERLESIPGVRSAALSETPPVGSSKWNSSIKIPGYVSQPKEDMSSTLNRVSPRYFETVGIPLVAGRSITAADSATSLKVCVINQALANRFFPKGDALGRSVSPNIDSIKGPWQIVGIARDTLSANPRDTTSERMIYMPLAQMTGDELFADTIELRTSADPANAIVDLRRTVALVEPNLPIVQVHTIKEQIDGMMTEENLFSSLTGIFSALALVLAAIGLYGVMSYSVVRRTSEIGIRLALGAQTTTVLWMVLRESILLLVLGLALGLPLTLASTRYVQGQLYGLSALDPATFATAISIVAAMTLIAAWLPARLASKVDPMVALRCD